MVLRWSARGFRASERVCRESGKLFRRLNMVLRGPDGCLWVRKCVESVIEACQMVREAAEESERVLRGLDIATIGSGRVLIVGQAVFMESREGIERHRILLRGPSMVLSGQEGC